MDKKKVAPRGVLLVNLGTPDSFKTSDVRKYLREFLSDPRVLDINATARYLLVNAVIAPFRGPMSAANYKKIWLKEGSPLLVYSIQLQTALAALLGENYRVELAMRYQSPDIDSALTRFYEENIDHITVVPLFPQYASATNGSVNEKVMDIVSQWPVVPDIQFIKSFHDDKGLIAAFAENGRKYGISNYDHVLFSFHGLPERQLEKADPSGVFCLKKGCCDSLNEINKNCYSAQCHETARLLAETLRIQKGGYTICFQSRLGRNPWRRPYTSEVIKTLPQQGIKKLLVFCPAFVADCLETVYEVAIEYDEDFKKYGGEKIQLVESLNGSLTWAASLKEIIEERVGAAVAHS